MKLSVKLMKSILVTLTFLFVGATSAQSNDTLRLYKQAYNIVELYKTGDYQKLLGVYKNSIGPRFKTEKQIIREMEFYKTASINIKSLIVDSVIVKHRLQYQPREDKYKALNIEEFYFEFKFPNTSLNISLNYYKITIVYSKSWYEGLNKPKKYRLFYILFDSRDTHEWKE